jgi:hypothetical protein
MAYIGFLQEDSVTAVYEDTMEHFSILGAAKAVVYFKACCPNMTFAVGCSLMSKPPKCATFYVTCFGAQDPDLDLGDTTDLYNALLFDNRLGPVDNWHWSDVYRGDGLVGDDDPDSSTKDLWLTVDYDPNDFPSESLTTLLMDIEDDILIGDSVYIQLDVVGDSAFPIQTPSPFTDIHQERALLRNTLVAGAQANSERARHHGLGRGGVHAILGGKPASDGSTLGYTVDFCLDSGGGTPTITAMHLGSSGFGTRTDMTNECLDSCGVYVFTGQPAFKNPSGGQTIRGTELAALVLAHEIGHALGLLHKYNNDKDVGVMSCPLDIYGHSYVDYAFVGTPQPEFRKDHQLINLRKILGRDAATIQRHWLVKQ